MALARRDRPHGEDTARAVPARRPRGRIGARWRGGDLFARNAVVPGQDLRCGMAGGQDMHCLGERAALGAHQMGSERGLDPGLHRQGVMAERDHRPGDSRDQVLGQGAIGEPIDKDRLAFGKSAQDLLRLAQIGGRGCREAAGKGDMCQVEPDRGGLAQEAPGIAIATGRRREISGDDEAGAKHDQAPGCPGLDPGPLGARSEGPGLSLEKPGTSVGLRPVKGCPRTRRGPHGFRSG